VAAGYMALAAGYALAAGRLERRADPDPVDEPAVGTVRNSGSG
jgi:hypothetical protein